MEPLQGGRNRADMNIVEGVDALREAANVCLIGRYVRDM